MYNEHISSSALLKQCDLKDERNRYVVPLETIKIPHPTAIKSCFINTHTHTVCKLTPMIFVWCFETHRTTHTALLLGYAGLPRRNITRVWLRVSISDHVCISVRVCVNERRGGPDLMAGSACFNRCTDFVNECPSSKPQMVNGNSGDQGAWAWGKWVRLQNTVEVIRHGLLWYLKIKYVTLLH